MKHQEVKTINGDVAGSIHIKVQVTESAPVSVEMGKLTVNDTIEA